jgi:hypothetical protein
VESENIPMEKQDLVKGIAALMESAIATPTEPPEISAAALGTHMADCLMRDIYDPMPTRGVRGILQFQQAHGNREEREKANKTFKDNCDEYEKRFGHDALVERLSRTYIGAYAESINCPVTQVSFSDAINWRSNQPKVQPQ